MSSLLSRLGNMVRGRPVATKIEAPAIRARFDNQFTTEENREMWAMADITSVDAAANFMVRRTLRMRNRYEYHNNPWMMGAANRLARFVIGPNGPTLHIGGPNKSTNRDVETKFALWATRINLALKMRTSRAARTYNGEGFLILRTNPKINHPVKLDLFEIEADQVSSPLFGIFPSQYPDQWFDGVTLDPWGNPETYQILRQHPGAFGAFLVLGTEFDPYPARYVIHDYQRMRPAQQRGIPEFTPALDLFGEMRRYRKAVLAAVETAADYAGVVQTDAAADGGEGTTDTAETGFGTEMDYIRIKRRQLGVLPAGWKLSQLKPEQPTQVYDAYMLSLLVEAGQVLDMPLFLMTGDARLANMASAYVATDSFAQSVATDRNQAATSLDKIFDEWLAEARCIPGYIPSDLPDDPPHDWRFTRISKHADPSKMATAQNQRLKNGSRSPSSECADEGMDFDEVCERSAADYGVSVAEYKAALFQSTFAERGSPPPAALSDDPDGPPIGDETSDDNH